MTSSFHSQPSPQFSPCARITMPKKKRLSRHGKKNERKNTNIAEVEAHLEQEREDALQGGAIEVRKNDQLFFIDTAPGKDLEKGNFRNSFLRSQSFIVFSLFFLN